MAEQNDEKPSMKQVLWILFYKPVLIFRPKEIYPFWRWMNTDLLYAISLKEAYRTWTGEGKPSPNELL